MEKKKVEGNRFQGDNPDGQKMRHLNNYLNGNSGIAVRDNTRVVKPIDKGIINKENADISLRKEKIYRSLEPSDATGIPGLWNAMAGFGRYVTNSERSTYMDNPDTFSPKEKEAMKKTTEIELKEIGKSEDAFKKYLKLPMDNENSFLESEYKPSISKDKNATYYRFGEDDVREHVNNSSLEFLNDLDYRGRWLLDTDKYVIGKPSYALGDSKISIAPDSSYVSIYDKYDFPYMPGFLERKHFNPFEYYDRIPIDKEHLKNTGEYRRSDKKRYGGKIR